MSVFDNKEVPATPLPLPKVTGEREMLQFLHLLTGEQSIGATADEEITAPISPQARAWMMGKLGEFFVPSVGVYNERQLPAYASVFRSLADQIDALITRRKKLKERS